MAVDPKAKFRAKVERMVKAAGVKGVNKPRLTPGGPGKAVVVAKDGQQVKTIRFGDPNMGHNYSPEARKAFKARHAKNIAKGKMSAAYWADKFLWAGPSGSKRNPPKGQKYVRGKIKGARPAKKTSKK